MRFRHVLPFGATVLDDGRTRFRVWAPSVDRLQLNAAGGLHEMQREDEGWHSLTVAAAPGTPYQYCLPDGLQVPDPASRQQASDVHDPSVIVDPHSYEWRNGGWQGCPWSESVIYELHPGTMGGFNGIRQHLPDLQRLGVTAIELMPIADFPGAHNWGYDGVLHYAPDTAYGTPDELKAMIDEAHGLGLNVMLDVVYNHFGPDGNYLHAYCKPFFREDLKTPWGASIDFRRPQVRDHFIQNALLWLMEYRFDGLRFDAVHAIADETFLTELVGVVRTTAEPGRHIHLVMEHEDNRASLLGGPPAYDAQWADDWHHCLHVLLTHDLEGYYQDFSNATALLARCLESGFAYQGEFAPRLGHHRGEVSVSLPPSSFIVFLQNHDQIGNRAMGERLTVLADPAALRAATALMLLSPQVPMLFMGEEYASRTPFLFFTSHNEQLAEAVREGRRAEFRYFSAFQDEAKRALIPDPNAVGTFAASIPEATEPAHFEWMRGLLAIRRERIVPGLPGCRSEGASVLGEGAVRAMWRLGNGKCLAIALNLGTGPVDPAMPAGDVLFATPGAEAWTPAAARRRRGATVTSELAQLAVSAGVAPRWQDYRYQWHDVSDDSLRAVLGAMELRAETGAQVRDSIALLASRATSLPPLVTAAAGQPAPMSAKPGAFELILEDGTRKTGTTGDQDGFATLVVNEPGYHQVEIGGQRTTLAVAPPRCFTVQDAMPEARPWALAVQLYSLRRHGDGGLGDFRALEEFAPAAAASGAAGIAISPVHAQFSADPDRFSPYSPSSRILLNVLHAPVDVPLDAHTARLEAEHLVDWPVVSRRRLATLRTAFEAATPADLAELAAFRAEQGDALETHARFEALHAHLFGADPRLWHWRSWPAELREPTSPAVAAFAREHAAEVTLHAYLQMLADHGLAAAQRAALQAGMPIGLIADLAVGADSGGSHCWSRQKETLIGLSIGAPPDLLSTRGQNWGLAAFSPRGLALNGYAAYIEMLRSAMRHAGGVRIDHALGLARLWVVPDGCDAHQGAYLTFPMQDMLRLIALESQRNRAVVLGEDLGTIPDGFQDKLATAGVLGMRVLWFERGPRHFVSTKAWSKAAAAMTSTHDLPTVAGWWAGKDLEWRARLDLAGGPEREAIDGNERFQDRFALWDAMRDSGAATGEPPANDDGAPVADAALRFVAQSACDLAIIPIEDALALTEQPNLPGTMNDQHPNWRRRLPGLAADLLDPPDVAARLKAVTDIRAVTDTRIA